MENEIGMEIRVGLENGKTWLDKFTPNSINYLMEIWWKKFLRNTFFQIRMQREDHLFISKHLRKKQMEHGTNSRSYSENAHTIVLSLVDSSMKGLFFSGLNHVSSREFYVYMCSIVGNQTRQIFRMSQVNFGAKWSIQGSIGAIRLKNMQKDQNAHAEDRCNAA